MLLSVDPSHTLSLSLFRVRHSILCSILHNNIITNSLVPTPTPFISNSSTLIVGTRLNLSCDYILSTTVNTDITASATWTVNNTALVIPEDDGSISSDGVYLIFAPLTTSHTGIYTCTLTITPSPQTTHVTVQEPVQSSEKVITVQSKVHTFLHVIVHYMNPQISQSLSLMLL